MWGCHVALCMFIVLDVASSGHEDLPPPLPISDHEFPRPSFNPIPYRGRKIQKQPPGDVDVASSSHEDPPPPLPISDHEFPRPTVNPVPYRGRGIWKQPPDDVDVGFVPKQTYSQVRRTSKVVHLPQSDAIESASDVEEVINAPRLREVVKHTQIREVYEEEGFEDNAYDHAGYKKAAEHQSGYKKGDELENKRLRRQRGKPKVDSQGQQSEVFGKKVTAKEDPSDEYEGKGDGAIEVKEMGGMEVENDSTEMKRGRGRGRYKFNGGDDDDGNRNYSYGRMMHTMDVKRGVDKMDDKGRRMEEKEKVGARKNKERKPRGNFLVNKYGEVIKNQARKRESPMGEKEISVDGLMQGSEELGSAQGSLEDSFGKEHSATDRPDKAEYLEAADEARRLKVEDAIRDEEIEQHYLETSADIAKDYVKKDRGVDHRKYPYYKTTKNKHSPLRYALGASEIPKKTPGGLEFYESKDFYHCDEVKGPGNVTPMRQMDGEWAGAPRKGIFPRLSGLGDKIDCFKNKYWGKEPLDSPFFKEGEHVVVENKKRETQSDTEENNERFEDSSGFYADIVGNIRNIEKGTFPATNFDSGGPLIHRHQGNAQHFDDSFERPTRTSIGNRYHNHKDENEGEESDGDGDNENRDERREESDTPTYPKYVSSAPVYEQVYTNPTEAQPFYKYKLIPVKTKRNHHHIILNILPPIKYSKQNKKTPTKNSYQAKENPKPNKINANSYPLYPPLGNENQQAKYYAPVKYYPINQSQIFEYQANNAKLKPPKVKLQKNTKRQKSKSTKQPRSPRPIPMNYSVPIKNNEDFINIFGMYPPPPNIHFKYQTLTLLAPNITTAKFRSPEPVQLAHASNIVHKRPMVDNMAQETYDVVAKVSNLTEQQLKHINVKLRVKRSRLYSDIKPVREDVDEDVEPKVIRKRKRPRKKETWKNDDGVAVKEEKNRSSTRNERRKERQEESLPVTSSDIGGYDVHEQIYESVHPFVHRDFDFPDEDDYSKDSTPQVDKSKEYIVHNHRPDNENLEENISRQPEATEPEESKGLKRKLKRRRKKPKKHFWRNEESYELNEKEPNVDTYVEWRDSDDKTEAPLVENHEDKSDEAYGRNVKVVEMGGGKKEVDEVTRRRRPSKRVRIPKPIPNSDEEEDVDQGSRMETRREVETTYRPHTTHTSLTDRINGWLKNNKDLEIISLDAGERKQQKVRKDSKPEANESDEIPDEEASSSEQTEVTVSYPKVSRNNNILKKSSRKIELVRSERGRLEENDDKVGSESKNSREKSTGEEERYNVDKRRGEPKYKEVESKKVVDSEKNNTHMTIHEEIRLTPVNAPPPIVLSPEEINAKLATLFKDQKYGSRYNAKEPEASVNTMRKLRPDDPDKDVKNDGSIEEDIDESTTTSKPTTTTTTTTPKIRGRPLFSVRSRTKSSNDTKEVNSEPKQESLRSRTQFSQTSRGRSRGSQATTEKVDTAEKDSPSTRTESNQRTKVQDDVPVKDVTRSRIRRPVVKSNTEVTTQKSTVVKSRSRYRFTTSTKPTPTASNEDSSLRFEGRKLSRKGRDKPTTEFPKEGKTDQKIEGSESVEEPKVGYISTVTPLTPSTTKAPKRIFLFNRPKPTTTVKPEVTTKRGIMIERPKKPVDILSKFETTNVASKLKPKILPKIPSADIKKLESKPSVSGSKTVSKLTQNRLPKVGDDSKSLVESKNDQSKPRQLNNFETRKVTKEEIFTTSYTPDEEEEDGEESDDEEGDDNDEYVDESENDDVIYETFEHPYFKYEQNNEQSKKVERFESPVAGWGSDHSVNNRNSIKGRLQKKGFLKPQDSLARQTLATDRTLTYIVDPTTRIGAWVEGRS